MNNKRKRTVEKTSPVKQSKLHQFFSYNFMKNQTKPSIQSITHPGLTQSGFIDANTCKIKRIVCETVKDTSPINKNKLCREGNTGYASGPVKTQSPECVTVLDSDSLDTYQGVNDTQFPENYLTLPCSEVIKQPHTSVSNTIEPDSINIQTLECSIVIGNGSDQNPVNQGKRDLIQISSCSDIDSIPSFSDIHTLECSEVIGPPQGKDVIQISSDDSQTIQYPTFSFIQTVPCSPVIGGKCLTLDADDVQNCSPAIRKTGVDIHTMPCSEIIGQDSYDSDDIQTLTCSAVIGENCDSFDSADIHTMPCSAVIGGNQFVPETALSDTIITSNELDGCPTVVPDSFQEASPPCKECKGLSADETQNSNLIDCPLILFQDEDSGGESDHENDSQNYKFNSDTTTKEPDSYDALSLMHGPASIFTHLSYSI